MDKFGVDLDDYDSEDEDDDYDDQEDIEAKYTKNWGIIHISVSNILLQNARST